MPGSQRAGPAMERWRLLIGPPLRAREVSREQITPVEELSALSLDALTSVALRPEAILMVLAAAGAAALHLVPPVTVVIMGLLTIPGVLPPPGDRGPPGVFTPAW